MASDALDAPKPGHSYWTIYTALEGANEPTDPLHFEMYVRRLGDLLLPGLTSRTQRLRYLSMICAGIEVTGQGRTVRERRRAFLPFERGWALAMTIAMNGELQGPSSGRGRPPLKPEFRGFMGSRRVLAHFAKIRGRLETPPSDYVLLSSQESQGALGSYLVALCEFGFVHRDSLRLTARGQELARAFDPHLRGAQLSRLAEQRPVKCSTLARLGAQLALNVPPTAAERQITKAAIFDGGGPVAECVRLVPRARAANASPRALFQAIGRDGLEPLALWARYTVDFEPLRIALLQLFCRLGAALAGRSGPIRLADLEADELEDAADRALAAARTLAVRRAPPGLERVSDLAQAIAAGDGLEHVVHEMLRFHVIEGRSWIIPDRPGRYSLGQHGRFTEPAGGGWYTLDRALQLFDEVSQ